MHSKQQRQEKLPKPAPFCVVIEKTWQFVEQCFDDFDTNVQFDHNWNFSLLKSLLLVIDH